MSDGAASPDGRWIAFTGNSAPGRSAIYIVPSRGGEPLQATRGVHEDSGPAWSPDGRHIFFYSDRIQGPESGVLHLMRLGFDPDAGEVVETPRPISMEGLSPNRSPVVSPDGQWVAYVTRESEPDPNEAIRVVPFDGGASRELTRIRLLFGAGLGWSEDSRFVIWDEFSTREGRERGLYRVPLEGGAVEQVIPREGENGTFVSFSGDGRTMLWSRGGGDQFPWGPGYEILTPDGTVAGRIAGDSPGWPRLSFDGSSVAAVETRNDFVFYKRPYAGGDAQILMDKSCRGDLKGWTKAGLLLVEARTREGCGLPSGESSDEAGAKDGAFLLDPSDGSIEDVSVVLEPVMDEGWILAIHPDGRHVLAERGEGSRREGNLELLVMIVDLVTGEIQTVSRSESSIWGSSYIYGNQGRQTDGDPDWVLEDRFVFHQVRDGSLHLMTVLPGEDPELIWTYPEDIVRRRTENRFDPSGTPVGIHGSLIAWVRSNVDPEFIEVTSDTRSTLMVTDYSTGETREVLTLDGYLNGPLWSRDGKRIALEYQRYPQEKRHIAILDLDDRVQLMGDPLILDAGTEVTWLGGWSGDNQSLFFEGVGLPGQSRWPYFRIDALPGAVPVNLTADDPDPSSPALLSPDGSLLVYPSRRFVGSAIYRWDLPPRGGR